MTDHEIKKRLIEIETKKIHKCAQYLMAKDCFSPTEYGNALREFGVTRNYFEQLYHISWQYRWVREGILTFDEFLRDIVFKAQSDKIFESTNLDVLSYKQRYKLENDQIIHYEQHYVYCIDFKKKDTLNLNLS
jgi:hypothetical protein